MATTNPRVELKNLTTDDLKVVDDYLLQKRWYAQATFTSDGNLPSLLTGGLSMANLDVFEKWVNKQGYDYVVHNHPFGDGSES